jgi:nicotinamidase-related amidase
MNCIEEATMPKPHDALLVVDPQIDFFPGGALPVAEGDAILPTVNRALRVFSNAGLPIFVTRDWHPADHCSFAAQGGPWPEHCVKGTAGAELHPDLELPPIFSVVQKATTSDREAYSDFEGTGLDEVLRTQKIERVVVCGLALEYCVRAACLDAINAGLDAVLLTNGTRAVEVQPGDGERTLEELRTAGVEIRSGAPE